MDVDIMKLDQKPVINYKGLEGIGELIDKRLTALGVDKMVATEDSLKTLKEIRSTLNKEKADYEGARKQIKEAVFKPYLEFEASYKTNILSKYNSTDLILKDKIMFVEDGLKSKKKDELVAYYKELCIAKEVDFTKFEQVGLNITKSASMKSLKITIKAFIDRVSNDVNIINTLANSEDYKADVLVEYKNNLDLQKSLKSIALRYEQKKAIIKEKAPAPRPIKKAAPIQEPLQAPIVEEKSLSMSFKVTAPIDKLRAVKQFLIENEIQFESI